MGVGWHRKATYTNILGALITAAILLKTPVLRWIQGLLEEWRRGKKKHAWCFRVSYAENPLDLRASYLCRGAMGVSVGWFMWQALRF